MTTTRLRADFARARTIDGGEKFGCPPQVRRADISVMRRALISFGLVLGLSSSCTSNSTGSDGGPSPNDAGAEVDAGGAPPFDAGAPAGGDDAGTPTDAGQPDAGAFDAGPIDAGPLDAGRPTWRIGGFVSGLLGSGLVLRNAPSDDLPIARDGLFSFSQLLVPGGAYAVTVLTQPTSPEQECSVMSGTGVAFDVVDNVAVLCATTTYTLGGTVSGLTGGTVVLQVNGGETVSVTTSGAFTFPTKRDSGSSYSVTVLSQPTSPAQTCFVSGATGTITAAVTSVNVTCFPNLYELRGTVSGLAGSGLVVRTGENEVAITANGPFTFPQRFATGTPYTVRVKTPPQGPTQTCIIANDTGAFATADVTNITVSCTTNRYSVRLSGSSLAGTGLRASLNGGPAQTVTTLPFTFSGTIESGLGYAVSFTQQPTNPWQHCGVSSPSGTVTSSDVVLPLTCTTDTYMVRGSVTGLQGSGLELTLSSGVSLPLTGTSFESAVPVPSGTFIDVVVTNPVGPSQTCVVTGDDVTLGGADLTLSVTCSTNAFSVGGTITGLTSGTVGLSLNDGGVQLKAGPQFTLSPPVLSGTPYSVQVDSQPVTTERCSVTAPTRTGVVGNGPVTNVAVVCGVPSSNVSGLTGAGWNQRVTLWWNEPADPTYVGVEVSIPGVAPFDVARGRTVATVSGLANGVTYAVSVRSRTDAGVLSDPLTLMATTAAVGTTSVDQQQPTSGWSIAPSSVWQSFTAGASGQLSAFEFYHGPLSSTSTVNMTAQLYEGEGTAGTLLATTIVGVTGGGSSRWVTYDFASANVWLVAGRMYTFRASTAFFDVAWLDFSLTAPYAGGRAGGVSYFDANPGDLRFRTYVTQY